MFKKILMIGAMVAMSSSAFAAFDTTSSNAGAVAGSASQSGAIAGGGDSTSTSLGVQGQGQAVNIDNHGVVQAPDIPVASAASVFVQSCQYGASGQGQNAGLSMGADSAQCMNLRQAAIHMELFEKYSKLALAAPDGEGKVALYKSANRELGLFQSYLNKADDAADYAHPTKVVGGGVADILPVGILIGIFTLI